MDVDKVTSGEINEVFYEFSEFQCYYRFGGAKL